ncbi:FAD-dependent monooxygenase [Streptomyces sp. NBC_00091]|uniref:FAD-dependent monooxygenase n=1 Tax=Streptomyces sp. NBC_00091 TaxID=2975648 RepID=UPI00224FBE49|nr:FAD-dependent monooxygenase [Streptomyces sp. NBC_00091]MCX5381229.1 FAD-dependent monooxygenase [Streptomyces sp. NBC_00091]
MQAQVAVIGGGPVGMLVAAELAGYGVDTIVLEARAEISERPKATTLHARAVQCLARRGHLPEGTSRGASGAFHFAGIHGLVITAPETEPEPILKCPQAELERLFETRARAAGARVLRGHRVTGIVEEPDGMRLDVEGPDGPAVCRALYLVGADGARSSVRERLGIGSDTAPATVSALVGLARLEDPGALEPGWLRTPRGWIVSKRTPGGETHIRTLDCTGAYEGRELPPTPQELCREVSRIAGRDIAMAGARWVSRFSDFTRLARTFRAGRAFLVGDAAHLHFPIGGQGLSTGVLDALNLSWKLALAVRGAAGARLLDTYDLERRPAAQGVIDNTRAQLALMRQGDDVDALRAVFTGLLASDRETGRLSDMISAQGTVLPAYTDRPSPREGRFLPNERLTTREGETDVITLLLEGRPLLLLGERGGPYEEEARPWSGIPRTVHVAEAPGSGMPYEALLLRPDGYIAWSPGGGTLADALSRYFGAGVPGTAGPGDRALPVAQPAASAAWRARAAMKASA